MRALAAALLAFGTIGCLDTDEPSKSFFRTPAPPGPLPALTPAATESAARVDAVGRQLLASNPAIGAQPLFRTIGSPQPEVFHRGTTDIFITEGLVQQCTTDGQLAAALAVELGKMVRERETNVPDKLRTRDPLPPIDNRLGNDDRMGGITDRSDLRELEQFDKDRKVRRGPTKLPDPNVLARAYLTSAGYPQFEVDAAQTALKAAAGNTQMERQIAVATAIAAGRPRRLDTGATAHREIAAAPAATAAAGAGRRGMFVGDGLGVYRYFTAAVQRQRPNLDRLELNTLALALATLKRRSLREDV